MPAYIPADLIPGFLEEKFSRAATLGTEMLRIVFTEHIWLERSF